MFAPVFITQAGPSPGLLRTPVLKRWWSWSCFICPASEPCWWRWRSRPGRRCGPCGRNTDAIRRTAPGNAAEHQYSIHYMGH